MSVSGWSRRSSTNMIRWVISELSLRAVVIFGLVCTMAAFYPPGVGSYIYVVFQRRASR